MNRRIRFRTYGGVRGRGPKGPLLLDPQRDFSIPRAFTPAEIFLD
jgi:hypothetical protein